MLIEMGAVADALTNRQETPLLLAQGWYSPPRRTCFCPVLDENACVDTVRVLVEQGRNDPMIANDVGFNSIVTAANNRSTKAIVWLMNQDQYEIDLRSATPSGTTAAALLVLRDDLSSSILNSIIRSGILMDSPCTKAWLVTFCRSWPDSFLIRGTDLEDNGLKGNLTMIRAYSAPIYGLELVQQASRLCL